MSENQEKFNEPEIRVRALPRSPRNTAFAIKVFVLTTFIASGLFPMAFAQTSSSPQNSNQQLIANIQQAIQQLFVQVQILQQQLKQSKAGRGTAALISIPRITEENPNEERSILDPPTQFKLERSLSVGSRGDDVRTLQRVLANPPVGGSGIYPEGLITGYFGHLTGKAVQRFQTKYGIVNSGTPATTGYGVVGPQTRMYINQLIQQGVEIAEAVSPPTLPTATSLTENTTATIPVQTTTAAQTIFYVSPLGDDVNPGTEMQPFKTIEKARNVVREIKNDAGTDIQVFLRDGRYKLEETIVFNELDSGVNGNNIIYEAYSGEQPILSGGKEITGWSSVGNGVYKAPVDSIEFRQLYVNGERAIRARTPNEDIFYRLASWDTAGKKIKIKKGEIASWQDLNKVEMVVQRHWDQDRFRIASFATDGEFAFVVPTEPERTRLFEVATDRPKEDNQSYHFENAFEFLDVPGEWYLNTVNNEVFYKPHAGEDMATAIVTAPIVETLLKVQGTLDDMVHNLKFRGITFEYTTWMLPSSEGYIGGQANSFAGDVSPKSGRIPAGIHIQNVSSLTFERNVLQYMGGMGLQLHSGTHDNIIIDNLVTDIAGNGISVDSYLSAGIPPDPRLTSKNDAIRNNFIYRIGQDYYGSVGIFAGYTNTLTIEHNELTDMPYSGISVGWGWTDKDTALGNNVIRYNNIYNIMNLLDDGGGVYTLSKQSGTYIFENYIHDIRHSPWTGNAPIAGVYLDNGSSFITVENNVLWSVPIEIHQNFQDVPASNNTLVNNESWLQYVVDTAGIEPAYWNILGNIQDDAVFFAQSIPVFLFPGEAKTVSVSMKNAGSETWTSAAGYALGSQNPQDNTFWGVSRVQLGSGEAIVTGQTKKFTFSINAPSTPGTYNFQWKMIKGSTWFGTESSNVVVTVVNPESKDSIGVFRPSTVEWFFDLNGNGVLDGCSVDRCASFGLAKDNAVVGDWNALGTDKMGVFRGFNWFLDYNGNYVWDSCTLDRCSFHFGLKNDIPVVGDWNGSGMTKIGVFRDANWFLDLDGNGKWDRCNIDKCIFYWGLKGDTPFTGAWNGDSKTAIGVFRNGLWYFDNGDGVFTNCVIDRCILLTFGKEGDLPVVGDWDGNGVIDIGIYRPSEALWIFDSNGNSIEDGCNVDYCTSFGLSEDTPLVGKWK